VSADDPHRMLIGGRWVPGGAGGWFESFDPATGEPWCRVAEATPSDVDTAVRTADEVFRSGAWSGLSATERGARVTRLARLVETHAEELAALETRETGKLLRETRALLAYVPRYYDYYAGLADKLEGATFPVDKPEMFVYSRREPLGVVAIVVPWNSPNYLTSVKLAPALIAGNTVVIKPSEHASLPILRLAALCAEAGIPDGVVNVVTGRGEAGAALCGHPLVRRIAFTGGPETARKVVESSAANFARLSLELGGKSPNLVFADADLDDAVTGIVAGSFAASGQSCVAGTRVLLQEGIADEVVERIVARMDGIRIGPPAEAGTEMGPIALRSQLDHISAAVDAARADGARVITGGQRAEVAPGGWFFPPTVVTGGEHTRLSREELFGPVISVFRFRDEAEAVRLANDTTYGLAAGIWTKDLGRAHRIARDVRAGIVWVNTYRASSPMVPFGGRGDSGYGSEAGLEGVDSYLQPKVVWVNLATTPMPDPFVMR
jgi:acyl-CoA reductase-like NAD-dependent aldehyde dehydrogenase